MFFAFADVVVVVVAVAFAEAVGMSGRWACVESVSVCTTMCASSYVRVRMCVSVCIGRPNVDAHASVCVYACTGERGVNLSIY